MTTRRVLVLLLPLIVSGCSFFSKSQPHVYSIERIPGVTTPAANARIGAPVGIDTFQLPPGFDRREIVVHGSGSTLEVRSAELWPDALGKAALHALAFDLANRLPEGTIVFPGEAKPLAPMRTIDVAAAELGAGPDKRVVLDAHWVLHAPGRAELARHERIEIAIPSLGSADVAAGVSRAIGELADRIAPQL